MSKKVSTHITEKLVKGLTSPPKGNIITYDDDIKGFGVRVTSKGVKSFILNYVVSGRERRLTIGQFPTWSVAAARDKAKNYKQQVNQGVDPLGIKEEERKSLSVKELWQEYKKRHIPNLVPRAQKDTESMFTSYILPKLGAKKVKDLTGANIDDLHKYISDNVGKTRANRVLEAFRGMINKGIRWGFCEKNPADGFRKNPEEPKENYLTPDQLGEIFEKLEIMPNKKAANIIRMLILTGARMGEVLKAEWSQFDITKGLWNKPSSHTKQKRKHIVPISPEVVTILSEMAKKKDDDTFLFPSEVGLPMHDIKKPWSWLKKEIGIEDIRIHDLRHSYASLLISEGESLSVIGKLLGHSQHQTTMRYAHLMDDPLRKATTKIAKTIGTNKNTPP